MSGCLRYKKYLLVEGAVVGNPLLVLAQNLAQVNKFVDVFSDFPFRPIVKLDLGDRRRLPLDSGFG